LHVSSRQEPDHRQGADEHGKAKQQRNKSIYLLGKGRRKRNFELHCEDQAKHGQQQQWLASGAVNLGCQSEGGDPLVGLSDGV